MLILHLNPLQMCFRKQVRLSNASWYQSPVFSSSLKGKMEKSWWRISASGLTCSLFDRISLQEMTSLQHELLWKGVFISLDYFTGWTQLRQVYDIFLYRMLHITEHFRDLFTVDWIVFSYFAMKEAAVCTGEKEAFHTIQISSAVWVHGSPDLYKHTFPKVDSETLYSTGRTTLLISKSPFFFSNVSTLQISRSPRVVLPGKQNHGIVPQPFKCMETSAQQRAVADTKSAQLGQLIEASLWTVVFMSYFKLGFPPLTAMGPGGALAPCCSCPSLLKCWLCRSCPGLGQSAVGGQEETYLHLHSSSQSVQLQILST